MIRKLRIALANWIMPKPQPFDLPIWTGDEFISSAVKTFPGGLTVIDKSMIKEIGPTIGDKPNQ